MNYAKNYHFALHVYRQICTGLLTKQRSRRHGRTPVSDRVQHDRLGLLEHVARRPERASCLEDMPPQALQAALVSKRYCRPQNRSQPAASLRSTHTQKASHPNRAAAIEIGLSTNSATDLALLRRFPVLDARDWGLCLPLSKAPDANMCTSVHRHGPSL